MSSIAENLAEIRANILNACQKAGRDKDQVRLVAVTKTQSLEKIQEAARCGLALFGENRVQEAKEKLSTLKSLGEWHLIGHLQTNKAKLACELFDLVQSVDSLHLAEALSGAAQKAGKILPVFAEVNVSGEEQKQGFALAQAYDSILRLGQVAGLKLCGLMAMAPLQEDAEKARPVFASLRELAKKLEPSLGPLALSMGMSNDYRVAVEEGATLVRIGRALFK